MLHRRYAFGVVLALSSALLLTSSVAFAQGIVDSATSAGLRPAISSGQAQTFLPTRGHFTFPAPYNTTGFRLTNGGDCGGADCVMPVGYSYWSNINNHAGSDTMLVFLGLERRKGGGGPTLFSYNKNTGETQNLGPLFSPDSPHSLGDGRRLVFQRHAPARLVHQRRRPRMLRYDVQSKAFETVFDVREQSRPDKLHLADALEQRRPRALGDAAGRQLVRRCSAASPIARTPRRLQFFAKKGDFDECQIDKSGRWLRDQGKPRRPQRRRQPHHRSRDRRRAGALRRERRGRPLRHRLRLHGRRRQLQRAAGAVRVWRFDMDLRGGQPATQQGQGTLVYQLSSWDSAASATSRTATRAPACRSSSRWPAAATRIAQQSAARQRDRLLSARRIAERARRGAEHDRPECVGRRQRRLLEAAEGQPRRRPASTSSGRPTRARAASMPTSFACRRGVSADRAPVARRHHRRPRRHRHPRRTDARTESGAIARHLRRHRRRRGRRIRCDGPMASTCRPQAIRCKRRVVVVDVPTRARRPSNGFRRTAGCSSP